MNRDKYIADILDVFAESGVILIYNGEDVDLSSYIEDSIQFMTILIQIEERFDIEFPDEILQLDYFSSLNGLVEILCELKEEKN